MENSETEYRALLRVTDKIYKILEGLSLKELAARIEKQKMQSNAVSGVAAGDGPAMIEYKRYKEMLGATEKELDAILAPYNEKLKKTVQQLENAENEQCEIMFQSLAQFGWSEGECRIAVRIHLSRTAEGRRFEGQKNMLENIRKGIFSETVYRDLCEIFSD